LLENLFSLMLGSNGGHYLCRSSSGKVKNWGDSSLLPVRNKPRD